MSHLPAPQQLLLRRLICALGLLGSVTLALFLPPFSGPDEVMHWWRAVHVSSGHVLSVKEGGQLGDRLPVWADDLFSALPTSSLGPNDRVTREPWDRAKAVPHTHAKRFVGFSPTAMYPPTFYVPQALAIKVGRILQLQPLTLFYVARVANLGVAWLAMAWAMALGGELILWWGALLLMPVVLQQLGTLSPDAGMIALTLCLAALVRRAATAPGAEPRLWPALTVIIGLLGQARPPLVALVALLWMPALGRHARGAVLKTRLGATAAAWALAFPWFVGCLIFGVPLRADLPPVHDKVHALLQAPGAFVQLLGTTTLTHAHGYLWMMVGSLGWLNAPISTEAFFWAKGALACALLWSLNRRYPLKLMDQLCVWLAMVGAYVGMQVIFFLTWTTPGSPVIEGFQGRYALMFLPLLAMALPPLPWPRRAHALLAVATLCMLVRTLAAIPWALLERYYLGA